MPQLTTRPCPDCKSVAVFTISNEEYKALMANEVSIQRAVPSLTAEQRERFLTGLCGPCYDTMCEGLED